MLRVLGIGLGLLSAIALGVSIFVWANLDDPPFPESHLTLARETLTKEQDGIAQLSSLSAEISWPDDAAIVAELSDESWNSQTVERFLERNAEPLSLVDEVLAASAFQVPVMYIEDDSQIEAAFTWSRVGSALRVRSVWHARAGRPEDALLDARRAMLLGRRIQGSTGATTFIWAWGKRIEMAGTRAIRSSLPHLAMDRASAHEWLASLEHSPPDVWRGMWAAEHEWSRVIVERMVVGLEAEKEGWRGSFRVQNLLPYEYLFKPNETLHLIAKRNERSARNHGSPCSEVLRDRAAWDRLDQFQTILSPNGVGEIIAGISTSETADKVRCKAKTDLEATRTMIAVRAFETAHGRTPERLGELVPEFLPEIPMDHFDGSELRYSHARRLLWSIGWDLADDGGVSSEVADPHDEPTWPLSWDPPAMPAHPDDG